MVKFKHPFRVYRIFGYNITGTFSISNDSWATIRPDGDWEIVRIGMTQTKRTGSVYPKLFHIIVWKFLLTIGIDKADQ